MLATVLLAFVAGRAGPAVAKPEQWSVSYKSVKLETIDKQEVFGVGIHYVPEDFYYTEDTVIAKKTHKAGSPVDVISADFKTPTANYTLYLFDTSRDGEFTPQAPPFSGKGDGMVLAYPGLENWFVVPFRDRLVLGGKQYRVRLDKRKIILEKEEFEEAGPEQVRVLERINVLRARAGLHNLVANQEAMKGCQGHVNLLIGQGWWGETNPHFGYASKCIVGGGTDTPEEDVDALDHATYHSPFFYLMNSLSAGAGRGLSRRVGTKAITVIHIVEDGEGYDYTARSTSARWRAPFQVFQRGENSYSVSVVPPNSSVNNALSHKNEAELCSIDPSNEGGLFGPPVYVLARNPGMKELILETAMLEFGQTNERGEFEKEGDAEIAHSFTRSNPIPVPGKSDNGGIDSILAKSHLLPNTWYRTTFTYKTPEGTKIPIQWMFKTK